jgi:hypothetical protein
MDWDGGFPGGLSSIVERVLYVGFSAVLFVLLLAVLALLVRFLWIGTKAAQIYVRRHEPPRPRPSSEYVQNTPHGPVPAGGRPRPAPAPQGGPAGPAGAQGRPAGAGAPSAASPTQAGQATPTAATVPLPESTATAPTVPLPESTATAPTVPLPDSLRDDARTGSAAHPVGRSTPRKPRVPKPPS